MDSVGAALYVRDLKQGKIKTIAGLNQNYAWGQDSWSDFEASMKQLVPGAKVATSQMPKLFAGQYNAEISTILGAGVGAGVGVGRRRRATASRPASTRKNWATAATATGTGTSTVAMVACCAHHVTDVLPVLGLSGAAIFLNDYRIPLMVAGLAVNATGVLYMARLAIVHTRRARMEASAC